MNLLFVCNQGQHRSRTAAELFAGEHQTAYGGIYSYDKPVEADLLDWSELIFVMEDHQREWLAENYPRQMQKKRVITLQIPDVYQYNSTELRRVLMKEVFGWLVQ